MSYPAVPSGGGHTWWSSRSFFSLFSVYGQLISATNSLLLVIYKFRICSIIIIIIIIIIVVAVVTVTVTVTVIVIVIVLHYTHYQHSD